MQLGASRRAEDSAHELLIIDLDPTIAVGIKPLERFRKGLDNDARAHEAIEGDAGWGRARHLNTGSYFDIYPVQRVERSNTVRIYQ